MDSKKFPCDAYTCLGETSVEEFLEKYWQKKPLLIRNAFANIQSPITPDELAGLACEEHVNARIVLEKHGDKPWQLEFGPFEEERFSELPESHWSLLVSDVEKHLPETKSLIDAFRFIPDWRIDDLMISYAPAGGSVGAHTDAYDVFLLQLSGQRLWKISEHYSDETLSDTDLCILKNFTAEQEWLLNPGDMLHLPPNVAHHGIAQSGKDSQGNETHCMTASIGFRAPSLKTISSDYIQYLNDNVHSNSRYHDKKPVLPEHHAEISDETVTCFMDYLKQGLTIEREQVRRWLGQYSSDNKAFEDVENQRSEIDFEALKTIATKETLIQSPYSHFLFSHTGSTALLFVDGCSYDVSKQFAEEICADANIDFPLLSSIMTETDQKVFLSLYNNGAITSS